MTPPSPPPALGSRDTHRRVWRIAVPVILSNISTPLVGLVDAAVVGHLDHPAYLAGTALGALILTSTLWLFSFLRMGTTGLAAQAYGAGDEAELRAVLLRGLLIAAAIGLVFILIQGPLIAVALAIFDAPAGVEEQAALYIAIRIWAAPAVLGNYTLLGWLLAVQRPGLALLLQIILNIINMALSLILVIELKWAVAGVATAALAAEVLALLAGLVVLGRWPGGLARWRAVRIGGAAAFRRLATVNINIMIRTLCLVSATLLFTQRGALFGEVVLAANALLLNLLSLLAFALDGFANAAEALVGAAKGAGNRPAFREAVRASTLWAGVLALLLSAVMAVFGTTIIGLLTDLPEVRQTAGIYLPWLAVLPLFAVWSYQLDGIFIGATHTGAMRNAMMASLALFAAAAFTLSAAFGNHGLWAAFIVLMLARAASMAAYYPGLLRSIGRRDGASSREVVAF